MLIQRKMNLGMVIGSGVFTAPVVILGYVGSVGSTLVVFLLASLVAVCGTAAYIEFGTMIPRSGGEKEYMHAAFPLAKELFSFAFTQSMVYKVTQHKHKTSI